MSAAPPPLSSCELVFELRPHRLLRENGARNFKITVPRNANLRLGRDEKSDVVFPESYFSRRHARLLDDGKRLFLIPEASDETLVLVNGRLTTHKERRELCVGDVVAFAKDKTDYVYGVFKKMRRTDVIEIDLSSDDETPAPVQQTRSQSSQRKRKSATGIEEDIECVVCSGVLAASHILPCGHVACGACLTQWLSQQRQCPECRADVAPGTVLAPVLRLDSIVEKQVAGMDDDDEVADYRNRLREWRDQRRKVGNKPLTVPPPRNLPARNDGPGRSIAARPRDIRQHFARNNGASSSRPRPPQAPPRSYNSYVIDLASNTNRPANNSTSVIDLAS